MWSDAGRRSLLKVGGCTILCTVQWLWRGACSTAGAAGDHVVSPFAATCRAPAFVLQREARTHASGESSYLELLSKAFFGSSRCRPLNIPDLTSPAVSATDATDELPATETPATPIQDVTRDKFRRGLHLSEGGTTAWTKGGTEALQHVEKDCMVKVEGETKVKRRLFSWYHPNDLCPTRVTMLERARTDALSDEEKKAFNKKKKQGMYVESHPQS